MDLSHPLRTIIPSLEADVLEVLAGTESGLGLTQIARLAGRGTRQGITPVLERLTEHGLVLAAPAVQGYMYQLNRAHVLAPVVLAAVGARASVMDAVATRVLLLDPIPVHASLFGSFARGTAGADSDIDLLVIAESEDDLDLWEDQVRRLAAEILNVTGNRCQALPFSLAHVRSLASAGEPIVEDWIEDGTLLVGERLADLLRDSSKRGGRRAPSLARSAR